MRVNSSIVMSIILVLGGLTPRCVMEVVYGGPTVVLLVHVEVDVIVRVIEWVNLGCLSARWGGGAVR